MTTVCSRVFPDTYRDSVFLMKISGIAGDCEGVETASAMMGTPRNKELLSASDLLTPEIEWARQDDLVVSIRGTATAAEQALQKVVELLNNQVTIRREGVRVPKSVNEALAADPQLNVAIISVPGEYAAYEALKCLRSGLHTMLYSDNVSIGDERKLKEFATNQGLLLMGPDCGTAVLGEVPLGFVNRTSKGGVGLVSASGTGAQQVMSLVDLFGCGISHCLGVGGRDLKDDIGGLSAMTALKMLDRDPQTEVIAVIAKPPGGATRKALLEIYAKMSKPVILYYADHRDTQPELGAGVTVCDSLEAVAIACCRVLEPQLQSTEAYENILAECSLELPEQPAGRYLRGVFAGGTLCVEALEIAARELPEPVYSNIEIAGSRILDDMATSVGHTLVDLGDDAFSIGRPHPMIDPTLRQERLLQELLDPDTGVVVLDVVLGDGSHPAQAEGIVDTLAEADARTCGRSRRIPVIASVCGTEKDAPSRSQVLRILEQGGVKHCATSSRAVRAALTFLEESK